MNPRFRTGLVALSLPITIAVGLASCSEIPPSQAGGTQTAPASVSPNSSEASPSEAYAQYQQALQSLRALQPGNAYPSIVNIGIDQSGSMGSARVANATFDDIQPILEAVGRQGGTFAISAICDRSDRPLVRETFAEPPYLDVNQVTLASPPERPNGDRGNPFHHKEALKEYEKARENHEREVNQALQQLTAYRHQLDQHNQAVQDKIAALQPQVETILRHPRTCQATDIQNAINRANWLFSEPHNWEQPPRTYAVFITDGLDTFSAAPARLKADRTILVHGSQDVGIFNAIEHQRFESPQSALAMLTTWLQTPGQN